MPQTWFSADWHLGHEGILTHRLTRDGDFASVDEMDAAIIDGINAVVKPKDTLYFLGDFGWQASKYGHFRSRLNVRGLHCIRGNHDRASLTHHCSTFAGMMHRKFRWPGLDHRVKIHMSHYPILSWDAMHHGGIHLYGHAHGIYEDNLDKIHPGRRSMDVGIDNIHRLTGKWRPISLGEVIDLLGGDTTADRMPGPFEELE
jgi:calcineurin-like phosphoesterase family protein